jgi:serine/threonine protein kinase
MCFIGVTYSPKIVTISTCKYPLSNSSTVPAGHYKLNDEVWGEVHESAKDMMAHMIVVDPAQRWTARQLLQHPWFEVRQATQQQQQQQRRSTSLEWMLAELVLLTHAPPSTHII